MAVPVCRISDIGSGHSSFPPTPVISGSPNHTVNSIPVARLGDALAPHGSPSPSPVHGRSICGCSTITTINSLGVARISDAICCGGLLMTGSPNTIYG